MAEAPTRSIRRGPAPVPDQLAPRRYADDDDDEAVAEEAASIKSSRNINTGATAGPGAGTIRAGWSAGQQVMDSSSPFAQALQLSAEFVLIKFLQDQPYANYSRHWVERMGAQNKMITRPYTCLSAINKPCPLCDAGDRPQAVSAFNVALIGDDGGVTLKTWDVGVKLFNVLKGYANSAKEGPLTKNYFSVNKTGKNQQSQTNVNPVRASLLEEDYGIKPVPQTTFDALTPKLYDATTIQIPKHSEMVEIALEIASGDDDG